MTPVVDFKGRSAIEAEATAWIVQLDGKVPSREDLAALRDWAARSPQHYATLRELAEMWGEIDGLAIENLAPGAEPAPAVRAAPRWRAPMAAAAALALLIAGGAALWTLDRASAPAAQVYATAIGEQRSFALADGSEVQLNTDSTVEVSFTDGARDVRLVEGEALFEVAHDAARPFTVYADGGAVRAVGTAFTVRLDESHVDVLVSEGVVELFAGADAMEATGAPRLAAHQAAVLAGGAVSIRDLSPQEFQRMMAWSEGMMVFQGEALSDVLDEVRRYTEMDIRIADPSLSVLRVGGRFGVDDVDAVLNSLGTGLGVDVSYADDSTVVISARQSAD